MARTNRIKPRKRIVKLWNDLQTLVPLSFYHSDAFNSWLEDAGLSSSWEMMIEYVRFTKRGEVRYLDSKARDNNDAVLNLLNGYLDKDNLSLINIVVGIIHAYRMTQDIKLDLTLIKHDLAELGFDEESVNKIDLEDKREEVPNNSIKEVNNNQLVTMNIHNDDNAISPLTGKKIFISHSSKDKSIIEPFIDDILKQGIGLRSENIICTSFEATGVSPGENIKDYIDNNIKQSRLFLAMISSNYKASEVCLNEVGAAWAVGHKPVQILLPGTSFDSLGWLFSLSKAIRIEDASALDNLEKLICNVLGIPEISPVSWNPARKKFLNDLNRAYILSYPCDDELRLTRKDNPLLTAFDLKYKVRDITEGEFQVQVDVRLRAHSHVSLKSISLANVYPIFESKGRETADYMLRVFTTYQSLDIDSLSIDTFEKELKNSNNNWKTVMDYRIDKDSQVSMSFLSSVVTMRLCDGYEDWPRTGWFLKVSFNVSDELVIPITLEIAHGSMNHFIG